MKKTEYSAEIHFSVKEYLFGDVVCLHVRDNVGLINEYKQIIDSLNSGLDFERQKNRGYGLKLIKEITLKNIKWEVNSQGEDKELVIPLCKLEG